MALDYDQVPEFAGPITAYDFENGGRWPEALGPQRAGPGEVTVGTAWTVYLPSPEEREARRHREAVDYDSAGEVLRNYFYGAARSAGADPLVARRTADALLERAPDAATPGISGHALDDLAEKVAKVVLGALAGEPEKPRRPHRRTKPAEPDPEPADATEATS
jgi:hypothetical protein